MKKISLRFTGYYSYDYILKQYNDLYKDEADYAEMKVPGIYCVYRGEASVRDSVDLKELIYIGQSGNVYRRLATHNKINEFIEQLQGKERLYVSFAEIKNNYDREWVESAMIWEHIPICNVASTVAFNYLPIEVSLSGDTALLNNPVVAG